MIKTVDIGPGSLTLGAANLQIAGQVTSSRLDTSESVASTDPIPVLSGEEKAGTDRVTHTHTLVANVFQDYDAAGLVAFSFANAGQWVDCTLTPNTVDGAKVTGEVCVVPITVGGDVTGTATRRGENPRSDISWRFRPADNGTVASIFTAS